MEGTSNANIKITCKTNECFKPNKGVLDSHVDATFLRVTSPVPV